MSNEYQSTGGFGPQISFWCHIWQSQVEQSFRLWGYWAQFMPRDSAATLAAEAEALKPVVRTTPSRARPATPKTARSAPKPNEVTPAARPVLALAAETPAPRTTPAKKAPRTPVEAKAKSAPGKPVVH
ncbi:hypothetical protein [Pararhodobacter aggregans]|uniref:hypothetical protein n=1 Tax=Pararhodobacter aggregans TaxID=404875 RepID=UPI003A90591B